MTNAPEQMDQTDPAEAVDRASARLNFFLTTELTSDPHGKLTARVRNLSTGGMMIELREEPEPDLARGHRLVIQLRGIGRVRGEIAWADGKRFGVKFDRDVDPELARKPVTVGEGTPDFIKPVLVPDRSLKYIEGLKGW